MWFSVSRSFMIAILCLCLVSLVSAGTKLPNSVFEEPPITKRLPDSTLNCPCGDACTCPHCIKTSEFCPCANKSRTLKVSGSLQEKLPNNVLSEDKVQADKPKVQFPTPNIEQQKFWFNNGGWRWSDEQGGYWYRTHVPPVVHPQQAGTQLRSSNNHTHIEHPLVYQQVYPYWPNQVDIAYTNQRNMQMGYGSIRNVGFGGNCSGGG